MPGRVVPVPPRPTPYVNPNAPLPPPKHIEHSPIIDHNKSSTPLGKSRLDDLVSLATDHALIALEETYQSRESNLDPSLRTGVHRQSSRMDDLASTATDHTLAALDDAYLSSPTKTELRRGASKTGYSNTHTSGMSPVPLLDFNWNNFDFFDEVDQSLDILNWNEDVNAQLDQLMNMNFLTELEPGPSTAITPRAPPVPKPDGSSELVPPNPLMRIPTSDEIPIKGIHSGPPPSRYTWNRLVDSKWAELNDRLRLSNVPASASLQYNEFRQECFRLPPTSVINLYVSAYMSGLNQHLPFLHLPSLDLNKLDLKLLLAICCMGAQYCFEKEQARKIHATVAVLVAQVR